MVFMSSEVGFAWIRMLYLGVGNGDEAVGVFWKCTIPVSLHGVRYLGEVMDAGMQY